MVNHSTENSKSNQKQNQISNEEQQSVKMSSEPRNISGTRSGFYDVQSELNRMNANNEGVQVQLSRMNTNREKMCACFLRMTHDRGKQIDHSSNGDCRGFLELDVEHRQRLIDGEMVVPGQIDKLNGVIGSKVGRVELKSFDRMMNQNWCSVPTAMDSGDRDLVITIGDVQYPITEEVLHQIFDSFGSFEIIDLCSLENGDVQAQIRFRCSSSAAWAKLSLQGRSIYAGCCHMEIEFYKQQQGGMNSIVTEFHEVIEKPNVQLSDCETNSLENCNDHTVFEDVLAEVETGEVLNEVEVILVEDDHANANANAFSIVTANAKIERGDESYNSENEEVKISENCGACFIPNMELNEVKKGLEVAIKNLEKEEHSSEEVYKVAGNPTDPTLMATGGKDNKRFLWKIAQGDCLLEGNDEEYFWKTNQGNGPFELQVDTPNLTSKGNASNGWQCGAANGNYGIKVGAGGSFVANNRNEGCAGDKGSTNGLLQVIFNDPFYDAIKLVLVNDKRHLLLAVEIAISMVEVKGWLAFECEVCRLVWRSQDMFTAVGIGAQWLRRGVG